MPEPRLTTEVPSSQTNMSGPQKCRLNPLRVPTQPSSLSSRDVRLEWLDGLLVLGRGLREGTDRGAWEDQ